MKRLVVYYSLSGNTEEAAKKIAGKLGADLLKLETKKRMPKGFAAQILVGGGQVMMKYIPELKPMDKDANDYDEIILGSPIWNSKGVPAINAFLNGLTNSDLQALDLSSIEQYIGLDRKVANIFKGYIACIVWSKGSKVIVVKEVNYIFYISYSLRTFLGIFCQYSLVEVPHHVHFQT